MIDNEELPIGFTMELALNSEVLNHFASLPKTQQEAIIDGARKIDSKGEMREYVKSIYQM